MSDAVKVALIVSATAVLCTALAIYFSPLETCVRAYEDRVRHKGTLTDRDISILNCTAIIGGRASFYN